MIRAAFKSGLYCVILPSFDPTATCLPRGLQQKQVAAAAAGNSLMSTVLSLNSYSPNVPSLLQAVKSVGIVGFQLTSVVNVFGVADRRTSFIKVTVCLRNEGML